MLELPNEEGEATPELIYVVFSTQKVDKQSNKPVAIPLPFPFRRESAGNRDICLIVKDPAAAIEQKLVAQNLYPLPIAKVIGTNELRTTYHKYEAKRLLCASYDVFLADDRVIPSLPKLIGKFFFEKKKQPIPVKLTKANLKSELETAADATVLLLTGGASISIKTASTSQPVEEIVQNVFAVLEALCAKMNARQNVVQSVHLKLLESAALPIFVDTGVHLNQ